MLKQVDVSTRGQKPPALDRSLATAIGQLIHANLYGYQYDYVLDNARMQCSLWCRGAGKSFSAGWKAALRALDRPDDFVLVSASENQAAILLRFCQNALDDIDRLCQVSIGRSVYAKDPGKIVIELFNGSRIISLPANPRTVAGYTANIFWDEVAKTMNDEEMWRALGQCTRGYKFIDLLSSAWGAQGLFYKIMEEGEHPEFKRRNIDIYAAIKQGLPRDIGALRATCDDFTWQQEFENKFQGLASTPFNAELLKICSNLNFPAPPPMGAHKKDGSLQEYFVGVDLGRTNDKTAIVYMTEHPTGILQVVEAKKIENTPLHIQESMIEQILNLPYVTKLAIDAGGLGRQMSDSLGMKFPEKLIPFTFSMQSKNAIVSGALSRMENSMVRITKECEQNVLYDLSLIQRTYNQQGNMIFGAKRNVSGHADGAWAFLLAVEASREAGHGNFYMDFGLDQSIVDMMDKEGSFRVNDIMEHNRRQQAQVIRETQQDIDRRNSQTIRQYMGVLTNNPSLGIFNEEEIAQMDDAERDFYGLPRRGITENGND
jgi:phage FluMu gp28-like protein